MYKRTLKSAASTHIQGILQPGDAALRAIGDDLGGSCMRKHASNAGGSSYVVVGKNIWNQFQLAVPKRPVHTASLKWFPAETIAMFDNKLNMTEDTSQLFNVKVQVKREPMSVLVKNLPASTCTSGSSSRLEVHPSWPQKDPKCVQVGPKNAQNVKKTMPF